MYSVPGDTTSLVPGFPIRTSSDQRSVDSSPRHIAASHVLHRLPVPRHPPCALKHLQHKTKKMSSKKLHTNEHQHHQQPRKIINGISIQMLATTIHESNTTPHHQSRAAIRNTTHGDVRHPPPFRDEPAGLLPQDPTVCLAILLRRSDSRRNNERLLCTQPRPTTERDSTRLTPPPIGSVFRGAP